MCGKDTTRPIAATRDTNVDHPACTVWYSTVPSGCRRTRCAR